MNEELCDATLRTDAHAHALRAAAAVTGRRTRLTRVAFGFVTAVLAFGVEVTPPASAVVFHADDTTQTRPQGKHCLAWGPPAPPAFVPAEAC